MFIKKVYCKEKIKYRKEQWEEVNFQKVKEKQPA